jgi:alkylhydroperoxidase/carboxymuconolactone decarboxylase family protein YurZ
MTQSAIQDMPILNEVLDMTAHSGTRSGLDPRTYFMVRIAALAATGAGPGAWAVNLGTAADVGLTREDVQSVLVAVAPVIGTARTVAAVGSALRGVGLAAAIADTEE